MRTIEIDEEVYQALGKLAVPFQDSPNDVLRRLLKIGVPGTPREGGSLATPRAAREKTPQGEYRRPILEALVAMGGRGRVRQVLERVREKMQAKLTAFDYEPLPRGGDTRWRNTAQWERFIMKNEGLLAESPNGYWEISPAGREYLLRNS